MQNAVEARCAAEFERTVPSWKPVSMEQLMANYANKADGMIYGIEFPWSKETLQDMGPSWLTKAFHTAGSLSKDNSVTSLTNVKDYIGGGACSKLTFDVSYEKNPSDLPTELFAKIPFPLDGKTKSDRVSSSVYQSGMEALEINASRLLEAKLPFPIPRYCFGDISNESSNFILITERIPFGQTVDGKTYDPAYDKMKDWELKGTPEEYYYLLIRIGAKMAGMYKADKLAPSGDLDKFFPSRAGHAPEVYGVRPQSSGLPENEFNSKLKMGADFIEQTAKALFPADIANANFIKTYRAVLTLVNAYTAEMAYYSHMQKEYVAWSHGNLNVDNAFFWRDDQNKMDVGVLDWGGAENSSMGSKLWWWLYCCEYDFLDGHIDGMLDSFITEYNAHGGPVLDREELRLQFIMAAMAQGIGLLGAVPQIYRMCPKKEWPTITDRKDPRISNNIDGKNTLRIYIGTFINVCHMIRDWGIPELLETWVDDWTAKSAMPRKVPRMEIDPAYAKKTMWKVVGGGDKGGILVREGESIKSKEADARLSTGAIVKGMELKGERLKYTLVNGTGPSEGWVSISLKGAKLVIPCVKDS